MQNWTIYGVEKAQNPPYISFTIGTLIVRVIHKKPTKIGSKQLFLRLHYLFSVSKTLNIKSVPGELTWVM